ncbi:MAG: hypothetical protein CMF77_04120 [Candidatus Marinimicrobia bacterium]|nr:hypothetical protein [Candidatus Neomarinimicrobiota bacterium]
MLGIDTLGEAEDELYPLFPNEGARQSLSQRTMFSSIRAFISRTWRMQTNLKMGNKAILTGLEWNA